MSKFGLPNYSWDTSVFIAWINEEKTAPLLAMELVSREIDAGKATLVVSALIIPEVLDTKMTGEQKEKFNLFLQRSNVVVADVTVPIATKARQIRDRGQSETPTRKIKTPDATVLATAILFKCDALHSLDDRGSGHLKLNGKPLVEGLRIVKPICLHGQLGLENF